MNNQRLVLISTLIVIILVGFSYTLGFLYGFYVFVPENVDLENSDTIATDTFNNSVSYFDKIVHY